MKRLFKLTMIRGKREVLIGYFPNRNRAESIVALLDWSSDWKPIIETTNVEER